MSDDPPQSWMVIEMLEHRDRTVLAALKACPHATGHRGALGIPGTFDSRWQRFAVCLRTAVRNVRYGDYRLAWAHALIGVGLR